MVLLKAALEKAKWEPVVGILNWDPYLNVQILGGSSVVMLKCLGSNSKNGCLLLTEAFYGNNPRENWRFVIVS